MRYAIFICILLLLAAVAEAKNEQVIVKYKHNLPQGGKQVPGLQVAVLTNAPGLQNNPNILHLEVDQQVKLLADDITWNIDRVGAPSVWNVTQGSGIRIAILDTGIGPHSDLSPDGGWNAITNSSNYFDNHGHGTAVAGVLAAVLNQEGIAGVSPKVDLYSVKVLNNATGRLSDVLAGVAWARANDMDIIVMSFGIEGYSQLLKEELEAAASEGILVVAAAGNDGGSVLYPAAYDSVIAVGATDASDRVAVFSNHGPELDLVAPGVNIKSTALNGYALVSGTSVAAPHVAGVAALVWSNNPALTSQQVKGKLFNDALDLGIAGKDTLYGHGLVQVNLARQNYTLHDDSYHYDIYNITDYESDEITFWMSGYGSIDDISWSPGTYRVTKYLPRPVNQTFIVHENGTVNILTIYPRISFSDSYTVEGTSSDGNLWVADTLQFKYFEEGNEGNAHVVCFDYNEVGGFYPDYCWAASSAALTNCGIAFSDLNTFCGTGNCATSGLTSWHSVPSSYLDSIRRGRLMVKAYYTCTSNARTSTFSKSYYVVDTKQTECRTDPAVYGTEGRFASNDWTNIDTLIACAAGKHCDPAIAGTHQTTTRSYDFSTNNNPCRVANGGACTLTSQCLTGSTCTGGVCVGPSNQTTDLAIVSIIPIQVIPNVSMVKGKSGYVVVNVSNNGNASAKGYVRAWFNGNALTFSGNIFSAFTNINNRIIAAGQSELFVFHFTPNTAGSDIVLNASVEVVE